MNTKMQEKQNEIIEDFELLEDWMSQYSYLLEVAAQFPKSAACRDDEYLVHGCQSKAWVQVSLKDDGTVQVDVDSDALLIRGILGLIAQVCEGSRPEEVAEAEITLIERTVLKEKLTSERTAGIAAAVRSVKEQSVMLF